MEGKAGERVEGAVGAGVGGRSLALFALTDRETRENQRERRKDVGCKWAAYRVARGEQGEADRAELARPERIGRLGHELLHDVWLSLAPSWVAGHLYASLH